MKVKDFCSKLFLGSILTMAAGLLLTFGLILVGSVVCQQTEVEAKAKAKVITVKKIDQKTAKKVHRQLLKGKAFTIRFKGGEKSFYKKFQKLTKKVAKQTDVGFDVFPICMKDSKYFGTGAALLGNGRDPKQSGKYTAFKVTKSDCQEYVYGIQFAEREYNAMRAYVDKVIIECKTAYGILTSDEAKTQIQAGQLDAIGMEESIKNVVHTLSEYDELRQYLQKTKFRDLSGTMKARIVLEVGGTDTNDWVKVSMVNKSKVFERRNSFKDLYKRKAYGKELYIAHVICKMCAVYNIGDFECYKGSSQIDNIPVRVKMKTRSGKTRYATYGNGTYRFHNRYVGYKSHEYFVQYRKRHKNTGKKLKKIAESQQMKQQIATEPYDDFNMSKVHVFNLDRSEW